MTFIIVDCADAARDIAFRNRDWHPIAEEIARTGLCDAQLASRLHAQLCTPIGAAELRAIASRLEDRMAAGALSAEVDRAQLVRFLTFARSAGAGIEIC